MASQRVYSNSCISRIPVQDVRVGSDSQIWGRDDLGGLVRADYLRESLSLQSEDKHCAGGADGNSVYCTVQYCTCC